MLIEKIEAWLKGSRNFIVGRALYKQLGNDEKVKQQLLQGETPGNKKLLREAMEKLLQPAVKKEEQAKQTKDMPGSDDPILQALADEWKPKFARMNYLKASLDRWGDSNDEQAITGREPIAFEILKLRKECTVIWDKRDHYLKHGTLPGPVEDEMTIPEDPVALGKFIETCKRNIRRNKAKMQKPGADAKFAEKYKKYKALYKKATGKNYNEQHEAE